MSKLKTDEQILVIARDILASEGMGALSFDAIARGLGRSKQTVLYWYPTKQDLLAALFLPWLKAEVEAAKIAVSGVVEPNAAIAAFVRAICAFHLADLDRFRLMYLVPQTISEAARETQSAVLLDRIHDVTDGLYDALSVHLEGDRTTARQQAFAVHTAVLGLVLMVGLADRMDDPLKYSNETLVNALIARLSGT